MANCVALLNSFYCCLALLLDEVDNSRDDDSNCLSFINRQVYHFLVVIRFGVVDRSLGSR